MKQCQKCGTEIADNMNFCPKCHAKYEAPAPAQAPAAAPAPAATPAPAQAPAAAPAPAAPKKNLGAKIFGAIGTLLAIGGLVFSLIRPTLLKQARIEQAERLLVRDAGFKAGSFEVRHIRDLRFGVWVIMSKIGDDVVYYGDKDTPAFYMELHTGTNKWIFPTDDDKEKMRRYSRVTRGDTDALLEE